MNTQNLNLEFEGFKAKWSEEIKELGKIQNPQWYEEKRLQRLKDKLRITRTKLTASELVGAKQIETREQAEAAGILEHVEILGTLSYCMRYYGLHILANGKTAVNIQLSSPYPNSNSYNREWWDVLD